MPHETHQMNAYHDNGFEWVAYCTVCSAESEEKLNQPCPGEYRSKVALPQSKIFDDLVSKIVDTEPKQD